MTTKIVDSEHRELEEARCSVAGLRMAVADKKKEVIDVELELQSAIDRLHHLESTGGRD